MVNGNIAVINSPEDALKYKITYVPAERKTEGLILNHSVKENITISSLNQIRRGYFLDLKKEVKIAMSWIDKFKIKTPDVNKETIELSGGNQQKIVLSKCLMLNPSVIIMNEPTKGLMLAQRLKFIN
ncbi:MAG: ATP-binding cassette domain-containing protein [Geovibrio sp.]|nr:ATP-binding cassette domain-containing protein [Geovibrio sp.]